MNLSPKSLNALSSLKERLLQAPTPEPVIQEFKPIAAKPKKRITARAVRARTSAYQRACQRHDWFTPVY